MPASSLEGLVTKSGWSINKLLKNTSGSGGNFCTQYEATSVEGKTGFLKAMDLSKALNSGSLEALQRTVSEYLFEQEILNHCRDQNLSKVVVPLDSGSIINPNFGAPLNQVYYIIFDFAEGDLRKEYINKEITSWSKVFRALHHVGVGIKQLHNVGIAHQDIKPSNILCFANDVSKISDLGRVTDAQGKSPFSQLIFTGDQSYAPIELRFNATPRNDFIDRRHGDLHMYGSLIYHIISGIQLTPILVEETRKLLPNTSLTTYDEALPFLKLAFGKMMDEFHKKCEHEFGEEIASEICEVVKELCYPDFNFRGNLKYSRKVQRLSLEKYISKMASIQRKLYVKGIC
ncbi:protein kinase family protein [Vibrio sp. SM6]|uniref:Protein kinase family protein n=1 Tax=Vibrio agarilyticus TaxID=2726741 RepID=A0A7X8YFD7_9VIBR|nr:protein kinase [Vibrio agarilyticus]NLS11544.1 protein kinase family protein [Vibrio agarilyticus]